MIEIFRDASLEQISEISKINPHFKCLKLLLYFILRQLKIKLKRDLAGKTTLCFYCTLGDNLSRDSTKLLPNTLMCFKLNWILSNDELFSNRTKVKEIYPISFFKKVGNLLSIAVSRR